MTVTAECSVMSQVSALILVKLQNVNIVRIILSPKIQKLLENSILSGSRSKTYMCNKLRNLLHKILHWSPRDCYTLRLCNKYHSLYYHRYKDHWGILQPIDKTVVKIIEFTRFKNHPKCLIWHFPPILSF